MRTTAEWLKMKNDVNSPTFELLLNLCYRYSVDAWGIRDDLGRGLRNWTLMADLQTDMLQIVNEFKRVVRKNLSDEKQMEKVDEDIKITLAPLFKDKMEKNSAVIGALTEAAREAGDNPEYTEIVIVQYLAMFNNFIEPRIYNSFMEILRGREASEPGRFSEMAGAAAGYLPQVEEKKALPKLPPEWGEGERKPPTKSPNKKGEEEMFG